jgi:osmoprotectant transport system permease protein
MSFGDYLQANWGRLAFLTVQHAEVVLLAVGIATVISVAIAVLAQGHQLVMRFILGVTGAMLTIPSFALFGLMIPLLGLGLASTLTGLVVYAIFPILRNVLAGLESVPAAVDESARGMGLSRTTRLLKVRLPLAWPVMLNGIRVATIMSVAIATIAAAVAGPGLGTLIFEGLARIGGANALNETLAGVVGVAVLAIGFDLVFVLVVRLTTPRGLRG